MGRSTEQEQDVMARIRGTDGNDYLNYDGEGVIVQARGGDDEVVGTLNDDVLWGAKGDDALYGAGGSDRLMGGAGDDIVVSVPFKGGDHGWVRGWGGAGNDDVNMVHGEGDGGRGDDHMTASLNGLSGGVGSLANLTGGSGADIFTAAAVNDGIFSLAYVHDFDAIKGDRARFYDDTVPGGNPDEVFAATWAKLDTNADGVLTNDDASTWSDGINTVIEVGGDGNSDTTADIADRVVFLGVDHIDWML
jgi:hypothetical protein